LRNAIQWRVVVATTAGKRRDGVSDKAEQNTRNVAVNQRGFVGVAEQRQMRKKQRIHEQTQQAIVKTGG
jgi:hypothetical protein